MKWFIGAVLGSLILFAGSLLYYVGAFKPVKIQKTHHEAFQIVYKKHVGPYHGVASVIESVEKWAAANEVVCLDAFGEYLDNPEIVDQQRLRSHGGCLVNERPRIMPKDYHYREVPMQDYITAQFEGAPSIGPLKVYPKVHEFVQKNSYRIKDSNFEIYKIVKDTTNKLVTTYLFPLTTSGNDSDDMGGDGLPDRGE